MNQLELFKEMVSREFREKVYRINWLHNLLIYLCHNAGALKCKKIAQKDNYHEILTKIKDNKKRNRCFIIGNGPSLSANDLEIIKDEDCFGTNGIFHIFEQTSWRPKYYCLIDRYASYPAETIRDLDVEYVFLGSYYYLHNTVLRDDALCIRERVYLNSSNHFSTDIEKGFASSRTVSFFAMQLAAYLGYKEIYLLGFDNIYKYEKQIDGSIFDSGVSHAHFYTDENPRSIVGDSAEMEKSYEVFKKYADSHGITVKNLTRGGKLDIFDKALLEDVLYSKE